MKRKKCLLFRLDSSSFFLPLSTLFIRIFPSGLAVCKGNNSHVTRYGCLHTILKCVSFRHMKLDHWCLLNKNGNDIILYNINNSLIFKGTVQDYGLCYFLFIHFSQYTGTSRLVKGDLLRNQTKKQ